MARITVEDCIDKFPSRFELVLVASQRARKLHSGDPATVEKDNDKNTVIALREIADMTLTVDQMKENLIQEYQTVTINDEEEENLELESIEVNDKSNVLEAENKQNEVEEELKELISSEDKEIKEQYEISESLELDSSTSYNDENDIKDSVEQPDNSTKITDERDHPVE